MKIPKMIEMVKLQKKKIAFLELREKQLQEDLEKWAKWAENGFELYKKKFERLEDRLDKINRKD